MGTEVDIRDELWKRLIKERFLIVHEANKPLSLGGVVKFEHYEGGISRDFYHEQTQSASTDGIVPNSFFSSPKAENSAKISPSCPE